MTEEVEAGELAKDAVKLSLLRWRVAAVWTACCSRCRRGLCCCERRLLPKSMIMNTAPGGSCIAGVNLAFICPHRDLNSFGAVAGTNYMYQYISCPWTMSGFVRSHMFTCKFDTPSSEEIVGSQ